MGTLYSSQWSNTIVDLQAVEAINLKTIAGYWRSRHKVVAYVHGVEHTLYHSEGFHDASVEYKKLEERWKEVKAEESK